MTYEYQDELDQHLNEQHELWEQEQRFKFALDEPHRRREFALAYPDADEEDWREAEANAWIEFLEDADWPAEAVHLTEEFEP